MDDLLMIINEIRNIVSTKYIAKKLKHTESYTYDLIAWRQGRQLAIDIQKDVVRDVMRVWQEFLMTHSATPTLKRRSE